MIPRRRKQIGAPSAEIKKVREKPNQAQQHHATNAATMPMPMAIAEIGSSLVVAVKSPRRSQDVLCAGLAGSPLRCFVDVFVTS